MVYFAEITENEIKKYFGTEMNKPQTFILKEKDTDNKYLLRSEKMEFDLKKGVLYILLNEGYKINGEIKKHYEKGNLIELTNKQSEKIDLENNPSEIEKLASQYSIDISDWN